MLFKRLWNLLQEKFSDRNIMICYVYFLFSEVVSKFYVGVSNNVADRLRRHNNGESLSTKHGRPWRLIYVIACDDKATAMQLERRVKKRGAKRFLIDNNFPTV